MMKKLLAISYQLSVAWWLLKREKWNALAGGVMFGLVVMVVKLLEK